MILKHNLRGEQSLKPFASRWVSSPSEYPWISVAHYAIPLDWRMLRHAFNWIGRRIFTGQSLSWPFCTWHKVISLRERDSLQWKVFYHWTVIRSIRPTRQLHSPPDPSWLVPSGTQLINLFTSDCVYISVLVLCIAFSIILEKCFLLFFSIFQYSP